MQAKKDLARRIVADFHSAEAATKAGEDWAKQFQKRGVPDEVEEVTIEAADGQMRLDKLLARVGLADSISDAVRKVKQKSVRLDGNLQTDPTGVIEFAQPVTLQVGRRIKRVRTA
jgi:tyrosyl-tRNA synthetase